ncbi:MAG: 3'-5' exonuclease [Chitinophagales bacterium]
MSFFKNIFSKPPLPPDWMNPYFNAKSNLPLKHTSIENLRFVVLDTETTGLDIQKDRLLSIGTACVEGKAILVKDSVEWVLYEEEDLPMDKKGIAIHGLRPIDLKEGTKKQAALQEFLDYLDNSIIVAHHTAFDVAMLNKALSAFHPKFQLYNPQLDTAKLAIRLERGLFAELSAHDRKKYTLDTLCERYEVETIERHSAWGDAYTTAVLFLKLLHLLQKNGIYTLKDLLR